VGVQIVGEEHCLYLNIHVPLRNEDGVRLPSDLPGDFGAITVTVAGGIKSGDGHSRGCVGHKFF
jgi:hypothetical protein